MNNYVGLTIFPVRRPDQNPGVAGSASSRREFSARARAPPRGAAEWRPAGAQGIGDRWSRGGAIGGEEAAVPPRHPPPRAGGGAPGTSTARRNRDPAPGEAPLV